MKLSDFQPNPQNPRTITQEAKQILTHSLDELGDVGGVVFNVRTRRLVGGHQRVSVLPPETEIEIYEKYMEPTVNGTVGYGFAVHNNEKFAVRLVDWPEEKEKLANIRANKPAGDWDQKLLAETLLELDAKNIDLDLTGYTAIEIEDLAAPWRTMPEPEPKTDPKNKEFKTMNCPNCGVLIENPHG